MEQARVEETNRHRLIQLHRTFYFGDGMSDIESAVEQRYLTVKNYKFERFLKTNSSLFKQVYTEANLRRQLGNANPVIRDVDYFDDLKDLYEVNDCYKALLYKRKLA